MRTTAKGRALLGSYKINRYEDDDVDFAVWVYSNGDISYSVHASTIVLKAYLLWIG